MNVLLRLPRAFLQIGVQVTVPMLTTLLCISEDFVISIVEEIESLGDRFPVLGILGFPLKTLIAD